MFSCLRKSLVRQPPIARDCEFGFPAAYRDRIFRQKENITVKLKVDHEADGLCLSLGAAPASESKGVTPGIIVDYDEKGQVLGIEMLHLSKRAPGAHMQRVIIESVPVME